MSEDSGSEYLPDEGDLAVADEDEAIDAEEEGTLRGRRPELGHNTTDNESGYTTGATTGSESEEDEMFGEGRQDPFSLLEVMGQAVGGDERATQPYEIFRSRSVGLGNGALSVSASALCLALRGKSPIPPSPGACRQAFPRRPVPPGRAGPLPLCPALAEPRLRTACRPPLAGAPFSARPASGRRAPPAAPAPAVRRPPRTCLAWTWMRCGPTRWARR